MPEIRERLMVTKGYKQLCDYVDNRGFRLEGMGRNETLETLCKEVEEAGQNQVMSWTQRDSPAWKIVDMFIWKDQKRGDVFWHNLHDITRLVIK